MTGWPGEGKRAKGGKWRAERRERREEKLFALRLTPIDADGFVEEGPRERMATAIGTDRQWWWFWRAVFRRGCSLTGQAKSAYSD